jgi:protein involved in polysaccharide export with SLBB domain
MKMAIPHWKRLGTNRHLKLVLLGCCLIAWMLESGCSAGTTHARSRSGALGAPPSGTRAAFDPSTPPIVMGNQVDLKVWGYPEFNTVAIVRENGTILVPIVGEVGVAGLTKGELEERLRRYLAEYIPADAKLTLDVTNPVSQHVAVLGAVTRQDHYLVTAEMPLISILSMAGGTTPASDLNHVRILREGQAGRPIVVNLASSIKEGNTQALPSVRPGDTVFVPTKKSRGRFVLEVLRDTAIMLTLALTLYRVF